jgi:hypothetical protein
MDFFHAALEIETCLLRNRAIRRGNHLTGIFFLGWFLAFTGPKSVPDGWQKGGP